MRTLLFSFPALSERHFHPTVRQSREFSSALSQSVARYTEPLPLGHSPGATSILDPAAFLRSNPENMFLTTANEWER
jgi:hypothetical protein